MIKKKEMARRLVKKDATIEALKKKLKSQGPSEVTKARQKTGRVQDALTKMSTELTEANEKNLRLSDLITNMNNSQQSSGNRAYDWEVKANAYLAALKNIVDVNFESIRGIGE